jgi:hypothetical protein
VVLTHRPSIFWRVAVLLAAYYPFCDERVLFPEREGLVQSRFFKIDDEYPFCRNLGPINSQSGQQGWIGESQIGTIGRSIKVRCSDDPLLRKAGCNVVFKRFYFDGFHSGYFSVGLEVSQAAADEIVSGRGLASFIQALAKAPVHSHHRRNEAFTLGTFGDLACDLYASGSVRKLKDAGRSSYAGSLKAGKPIVVISAISAPDQIALNFENSINLKLQVPIGQATSEQECFGTYLEWKGMNFVLAISSAEKNEAAASRFLRAGVARLYLEVFALEKMIAVLQGKAFDRCDEEGRNIVGEAVNRALGRLQGADKPQISSDQKSYDVLIETFSHIYRPGRIADLDSIIKRLRARPNLRKSLSQSHLVSDAGTINITELVVGNKEIHNQSGGVSFGDNATVSDSNIAGHDQTNVDVRQNIDEALKPVAAAIAKAPPEKQAEATQTLEKIKTEAAKGKGANDGVLAKLVDSLAGLVPSAVTAVVSAFGTPLLGGIAGPVTKFVLDKFKASQPVDQSGPG